MLDDDKHYWVGADEVEKLLKHGEGWLATHPEREAIERRISLNEERLGAVLAALKASGAKRVLDLGCGEGKLLRSLLEERQFEEIVGVDVSNRTLERAADRLNPDRMPPMQRQRLKLMQGALTYRDRRLQGFHAAAVVEVIEHLDPPRLAAFSRVLFECGRRRSSSRRRTSSTTSASRVLRRALRLRRPPRADRPERPRGRLSDADGRLHAAGRPVKITFRLSAARDCAAARGLFGGRGHPRGGAGGRSAP